MFTGIIKAVSPVQRVEEYPEDLKIQVLKPVGVADFASLKPGDSVAVNGVCLSLESVSPSSESGDVSMCFHLAYETLKITGWTAKNLLNKNMNLEPPLRKGDFIGGHFVSAHADGMAELISQNKKGAGRLIDIKIPDHFISYFWKKAFIALNGVSLTVNAIKGAVLSLCLIPETLKRTNLSEQKPGDFLTFEADHYRQQMLRKNL